MQCCRTPVLHVLDDAFISEEYRSALFVLLLTCSSLVHMQRRAGWAPIGLPFLMQGLLLPHSMLNCFFFLL